MTVIFSLLIPFMLSFTLTLFLRKFFLKRELIDLPNERSSHKLPTPHGGGLAIVLTLYISVYFIFGKALFFDMKWQSLLLASMPIAIIGFLDDLYDLSAKTRLVVQGVCASVAAYLILSHNIEVLGVLSNAWIFFLGVLIISGMLIWVLNLYNFMDGINGIAGLQSISLCLGILFISFLSPLDTKLILLFFILLGSSLGFLVWNFPNAKIFMGDVGSGFLGFIFAVAATIMAFENVNWISVWLILFATFFVDASVTLIRRFLRGEKIYQAHCSHAYQYAARKYKSHTVVTCAFTAINMLYLIPLALLVSLAMLPSWAGLLLAYIPLTCLAFLYKAGAAELQNID